MVLGKISRHEIWARPMRALLTFMSIAIGVAAVVAVLLTTSTTRATQAAAMAAMNGRTDLEISGDGASGFSYDVLAKIRENQAVEAAVPSLTRFAVLFIGERKARTQVLGIDPRVDQEVRQYKVSEGAMPDKLDQIMVDRSFAQSLELKLDDEVKILGRGGLKKFKIVGLVDADGTDAVSLSGAAYLVLPAAQNVFRSGSVIDKIQIVLKPKQDLDKAQAELASLLPSGLNIGPPRGGNSMSRETLFATENALYMSIAFVLLIAMFIIYNTFGMSVGERTKQMGVLRAIGTTRSQIRSMILREAVGYSVLASIVGCGLGVLGASFLSQATQRILQVPIPGLMFSIWPFVIAVVVGVVISLLGAYGPARRASMVSPLEAMRAINTQQNSDVIRYTKPLSIVFLPLGFVMLYLAVHGYLPLGGDVVAIVLILLGVILAIPAFLRGLTELIVRCILPWMGVEARLAQKQLMRHVGRTTLTIGVLFIAVSTSVGLAGNIMDHVQNVRDWYSRTIVGDFFIRASVPDLATGTAADIPEEIGAQLRAISGIKTLDPMQFIQGRSGDNSVLIIVRDFVGNPTDFFDIVGGTLDNAMTGLRNNGVVVGSVLARRMKLKIGDDLPINTQQGESLFRVAAITNDYMGGGLTVYMQQTLAAEVLGAKGVDAYVINVEKGQRQSVEQKLKALCVENGLIFQSYAQVAKWLDGLINGVVASLWMLLAMGCLIAFLGLVNTLTMSILEQTREIGMLRVVAMTRRQVRKTIISQAVLLGLIGVIPGAIAGVFIAYAISLSSEAILGRAIAFHWRPELLLACLAGGMVVVLLGSLIPAERAARLKLSAALHYD